MHIEPSSPFHFLSSGNFERIFEQKAMSNSQIFVFPVWARYWNTYIKTLTQTFAPHPSLVFVAATTTSSTIIHHRPTFIGVTSSHPTFDVSVFAKPRRLWLCVPLCIKARIFRVCCCVVIFAWFRLQLNLVWAKKIFTLPCYAVRVFWQCDFDVCVNKAWINCKQRQRFIKINRNHSIFSVL